MPGNLNLAREDFFKSARAPSVVGDRLKGAKVCDAQPSGLRAFIIASNSILFETRRDLSLLRIGQVTIKGRLHATENAWHGHFVALRGDELDSQFDISRRARAPPRARSPRANPTAARAGNHHSPRRDSSSTLAGSFRRAENARSRSPHNWRRRNPARRLPTASATGVSPAPVERHGQRFAAAPPRVCQQEFTRIGHAPPSPSTSCCSSVRLLMRPASSALHSTRTSGIPRRLTHAPPTRPASCRTCARTRAPGRPTRHYRKRAL